MTAMPQLVSMFNAVGGGAAALVAIYDYIHDRVACPAGCSAPPGVTVLDVIIGAVTFSGSLIAAGKLQGVITGQPVDRSAAAGLLNVALGGGRRRHGRVHARDAPACPRC